MRRLPRAGAALAVMAILVASCTSKGAGPTPPSSSGSGTVQRGGTLTFPSTAADGEPIIGPTTRTLELVIHDVADVPERSFQWAL